MAIPQLTVANEFEFGLEGQDIPNFADYTRGFTLETAVQPGKFAIRGTDPESQADELAGTESASTDLLGLVLRQQNTPDPNGVPTTTNQFEYVAGDNVPVKLRGRAVVIPEDAVTAGGQVFVRVTATGMEVRGSVRSDSDSGDAIGLPLDNAFYERSAGAGEPTTIVLALI